MSALEYFKLRLEATVSPMDTIGAMKEQPEDVYVVDVRVGPPDLLKEVIAGAVRIPQPEIESRMSELPSEKLIVLYCWDTWCSLAVKAAVPLLEAGLNVKELYGGMAAWNTMGLPTQTLAESSNADGRTGLRDCGC